jgi:hypothetical protein
MGHGKTEAAVPRRLAHTNDIGETVKALAGGFERDAAALGGDHKKWYIQGVKAMAHEVLSSLRNWPPALEALQESQDEGERLKSLCQYAQELDAERLEILLAIRVIQEERAARSKGGATCSDESRQRGRRSRRG